jgi:hypothetical protein
VSKPSYKIFIALFTGLLSLNVLAQRDLKAYQEHLQIAEALYPPEDILSGASLVLFSFSKDVEPNERKNLMIELQAFFSEEGIDAVAYVDVNALFMDPAKPSGVPAILRKRQIKNLVMLHYQGEDQPLFLAMGSLSDLENYWRPNDLFWMRYAESFEPIFEELNLYFKTGTRTKTNLLINTSPEYFEPKATSEAILLETMPRFNEGDQVAMKNWNPNNFGQFGTSLLSDQSITDPSKFKQNWIRRHETMAQVAADTANVIDWVEEGATTRQMLRFGYDYELAMIYGNHAQLQGFFNTETPISDFEGERVVFYLKSLRSNTIYMPQGWVPSEDWSENLGFLLESYRPVLYPENQD